MTTKTYIVVVQQPYTQFYEQEVEVQAASRGEAAATAVKLADENGWDDATLLGDGECGAASAWTVAEVVKGKRRPGVWLRPETPAQPNLVPELLKALRWALEQIEDSLDPDHKATLASARALVAKAATGA